MNKSRLLGAVCACLLTFTTCLNPAYAVTTTANIDVDLDNYDSFDGEGYSQTFSVSIPTLSVGDIVDTTLNFIDEKSLTLSETSTGVHFLQIVYFPSNGATGTAFANTTFEFLGVNGDLIISDPIMGTTSCGTCIASTLFADLTNSSFSFAGLNIVSEITAIPDPFGSDQMLFSFSGWNAGTVSISSVPIPASVWLFGSGLLGLIGIARKKA